jgi:excinuclease ABC subunit C
MPARPGVYFFKDAEGGDPLHRQGEVAAGTGAQPLRRGRATSLKNREMLRRVADIDTIVVGSEAEALLLEANLIKEHRPRFNIQLRDDKRYPYIKVTLQESFPRVYVTRRLENDGARYFGPYTEVGAMRQALEVVKRLYTVRSCRYDLPEEAPARPCLDYHIGRCLAPCVGLQSARLPRHGGRDPGGPGRPHAAGARPRRADMQAARSPGLRAGRHAARRAGNGLDSWSGGSGRWTCAAATRMSSALPATATACAVLLRIRGGKLLGREVDFFENLGDATDADVASTATTRFYFGRGEHGTTDLPRDVLLPLDFDDRATIEELLAATAQRRIATHVPGAATSCASWSWPARTRGTCWRSGRAGHAIEARRRRPVRPAGGAGAEGGAPADGVLRHLPHAGHRGRRQLRRVPQRRAGQGRVPPLPHPGDWGNDDYRSMQEIVTRYVARRIAEGRSRCRT